MRIMLFSSDSYIMKQYIYLQRKSTNFSREKLKRHTAKVLKKGIKLTR